MLALSIRQPYAELILRGIKTVEYRTRATRIIGERFHIYAAKKPSAFSDQLSARKIWSWGVRELLVASCWLLVRIHNEQLATSN